VLSTDVSDINAKYCRSSFVRECFTRQRSQLTEARDPRKCDVHVDSDSFVPYLVDRDISIKIDGAVVDEFNEGQNADDGNRKECDYRGSEIRSVVSWQGCPHVGLPSLFVF
jgi:hypothetical protein